MNSFPVQQQYPQPQTQPQQAPGIDPTLLAAFRNQGQAGGNSSGNVNGNKFPYGGGMGGGGAFNPQMMQNSQGGGGTLNPAHLMNGASHHQQHQQQQHQTVNPQQMFQQSHQQPQQQQQHGMMNGGMGINPATLNSNHVPTNQHPLSGLTREQMQQHYNSMSPQQQQILQAKMAAANAQAAISQQHQQQQQHHAQQQQQQQFQSHSHSGLQQQQQQQQQNPVAQQHALQQILAQQQHQHQQAAYFGDRPSSSASSQPQMMPPPVGIPPRPPTAGPGPSSRPGTSHSHGSASQAGLSGGQMQMQRPPSRPTTAGGFDGQQQQQHQYPMANGNWNPNQPKPMTPQQAHFGQQMQAASGMQQQQQQQQQQHQQQYHQQQQQHHQQHSPPPGSPYRGAKRKVANGMAMDSPRMGNPAMMGSQMGSGMNMSGGMMGSSMGPPGMARQISSSSVDQPQAQQQSVQQNYPAMANGFPQQSQSQSSQQQHQSQSTPSGMRPQSSNGHIATAPHTPMHSGGGMSAMLNDPTRINGMGGGMGSIPGGMNMGGLGSNMGLMGMSGANDALPRTPQRNAQGGQIPGYPALGSTMPTQQHRQPSTPAFSPQLPPGLQQSMMQPHGPKPSLDQAANMGIKMGSLPQLSTGGFTGLDPRPAGLPSRIPSAAPTQPINSSMAAIKQTPPVPGIHPVLAPLPANVQLNHQVTRVTVVPLAGSDKTIPPLSQSEIKDIQAWKQADKDYEGIWRKMKERMVDELRTATGPSNASWWEKDAVDLTRRKPREQFDVRYPRQKRDRDGRDRRKTGRREGLKLYVF
jgi:SWI/SNF-related matrix-associated actin-dependent regulator of chromatin subfamily B protein 1